MFKTIKLFRNAYIWMNFFFLFQCNLNISYRFWLRFNSFEKTTESFLAFQNELSNVFICYSKWRQYKTTNMGFRDKKNTIFFKKMESLNNSMFCKNIFKSFWHMHVHIQSGFNVFFHCFYSLDSSSHMQHLSLFGHISHR